MKYNTSVITYFVIPSGATSGQRIVLNGETGEIDLYNSANELVGQWQPLQWGVFAGSPHVGQSITVVPNYGSGMRPSIIFAQTPPGGVAIIDSTDDGSGNANLNVFGTEYFNASGALVSPTLQLHNGNIFLGIINSTSGINEGPHIFMSDTQLFLSMYDPSTGALNNSLMLDGTARTIPFTPDATQTGGIKTPTLQIQYSTVISSAWLKVLGAGVWVALAMANGYTAGSPAPAITLLPDGTLAFRGVLRTRAAPASGDVCMNGPTNVVPTAVRALMVMTLLNPNTLLQLNFNLNGSFQLFGGGPNPPGNTNISLDSIPPIPVAF